MNVAMLALIVLATARLTRLVTTDVLLDAPRTAFLRWRIDRTAKRSGKHPDEGGKLAYLIVCDWCASVYIGAAVSGAWWAWGETIWYTAVLAALSASYAAGFLASKTEG